MNLQAYKLRVRSILDEFFTAEDFEEVARGLDETGAPVFRYEFVKRAIVMAMGRSARDRELLSRLFSHLYDRHVLKPESVGKGFERLFEQVDDLSIDYHDAPQVLANFLARAVADELLPPAFLSDSLVEDLGGEVVTQAKVLLSMPHAAARLERVWGPGSTEDLTELKESIRMALEEYLDTRDLNEAARCLGELKLSHFRHEVVKRSLVLGLERSDPDRELLSALLAHLSARGDLSEDNAVRGFRRVREDLPDLELDVPMARTEFGKFLERAIADGVLPVGVDLTPSYLQGA